jgi:hypothetical protein
MGFPQNICNIYREFLSDRKAYVTCGNGTSTIKNIHAGCVQGSPSGPFLFSLLVNAIEEHVDYVDIVGYADDNYFIYQADTWEEAERKATTGTSKAINFLKRSGMIINESKTEAAYFCSKEITINKPIVKVNDIEIEAKSKLNILGILFDHKMSFEYHIDRAVLKAKKCIFAIRQIAKFLTCKECINVAHGIFYSNLYYGSCVWLTPVITKSMLRKLTMASSACLRAIFKHKIRDISTLQLHDKANVLTPVQHMHYVTASMFWKIVNYSSPEIIFNDLLTKCNINERLDNFNITLVQNSKWNTFSYSNRLNLILPLLSTKWLDSTEVTMKLTLRKIVLTSFISKGY